MADSAQVMSMATAFVKNFGAGVAVRFLLGVFEAGVLPGMYGD